MTIKKLFHVAWVKYIEDCYQNYHYDVKFYNRHILDKDLYYCGNGKCFTKLEEAVRYAYANAYHVEIELDEDPTQKEERWFIR